MTCLVRRESCWIISQLSLFCGLCPSVIIAGALFDSRNMMGPGSRKSVPRRGKDGARSQSCGSLNAILQLGAVYARKTYTTVSL